MTGERRVVTVVGVSFSRASRPSRAARAETITAARARTARRTAWQAARIRTTRARARAVPLGGTSGAAAGQAGRGSPTPLPPPSAHLGPGSVCESDGWCWYNPLPSGAWWQTVAGAGRTDLWIGGQVSTVLHFDGGRWTSLSSPLSAINGVWAASENDVWFGGIIGDMTPGQAFAAGIAHWDGVSLTLTAQFPGDIINDVWGSGPNDVYAVGTGYTTWHWDGSAWTALPGVPGGQLITGSGPNDVWLAPAVGSGLLHFDGTTWSPVARDGIGEHRQPGRDRARRRVGHRPSRLQPDAGPALRRRRLAYQPRRHRRARNPRGPGCVGDRRRLAGRVGAAPPRMESAAT